MAGLQNKQVRVLKLHTGKHEHATIYRLEKGKDISQNLGAPSSAESIVISLTVCSDLISGYFLHFVLGPSLVDKDVRVFVNQPGDQKAGPDRQLYRELFWENLSASKSDVYDSFAELHIVLSGSFNYFFTINGR